MEKKDKQKFLKWLFLVMLALIGTNLANYYYFGSKAGQEAAAEEPRTIIRYEPGRHDLDPDMAVFWEVIDTLSEKYYHPVDTEELIEGAIQGLIKSIGDPHVRYYNAEELEEFLADSRGTYGGIGVRIIEANGSIVVFETFADTPAARSGLAPGDRILEADGYELTGQGLDRAVELLRGPGDTTVEIKIRRPGADEPIELTVSREEIQVATVFSEMFEQGVGYMRISSFDGNTARDFISQFQALEESGLGRGLILDLRNNPGGLVPQAVEIAQQLVPEGEIVRLVGRDGKVKTVYYSSAARRPYPIVVLINEETASSSELLAGALQDRKAALLVGKTTYGKASTQQLEYLSEGNGLLVTTANYITPSGHNIDEHGIKPDYEVDMPEILRYYRYFHPGSLERGDYGPEVEMLQTMLDQIGYELEISGYFDDHTARVLIRFQADRALERSGQFDELTWINLRRALDVAAREQDQQLNYALGLLDRPDLWDFNGGND